MLFSFSRRGARGGQPTTLFLSMKHTSVRLPTFRCAGICIRRKPWTCSENAEAYRPIRFLRGSSPLPHIFSYTTHVGLARKLLVYWLRTSGSLVSCHVLEPRDEPRAGRRDVERASGANPRLLMSTTSRPPDGRCVERRRHPDSLGSPSLPLFCLMRRPTKSAHFAPPPHPPKVAFPARPIPRRRWQAQTPPLSRPSRRETSPGLPRVHRGRRHLPASRSLVARDFTASAQPATADGDTRVLLRAPPHLEATTRHWALVLALFPTAAATRVPPRCLFPLYGPQHDMEGWRPRGHRCVHVSVACGPRWGGHELAHLRHGGVSPATTFPRSL